jgi:hypothetical protein
MNKTNSGDLNEFLQLSFSLLFCRTRSEVSKVVRKKKNGKLPGGGKLEALTVVIDT